MSEQIELIPGFYVDPIPEPHIQMRRLMLATSMLIAGRLDTEPEDYHPYLRNCFLAPEARIVIAGTRCPRPLMLQALVDISNVAQHDAIVVRLGDPAKTGDVTFDIHVFGTGRADVAYRLWMPQPTGAAWLVPTAGENRFIRFDPAGFDVADDAPFSDAFDRRRGLVWASEFLSVATKGWF